MFNMPGFNRQGPQGNGPQTGRRLGRCASLESGSTNTPEEQVQTGNRDRWAQFGKFSQGRQMRRTSRWNGRNQQPDI